MPVAYPAEPDEACLSPVSFLQKLIASIEHFKSFYPINSRIIIG
jgi:hypothetical protein